MTNRKTARVVEFPTVRRAAPRVVPINSEPAHIIILPIVRIERHEPVKPRKRRRRA